MLLASLRFAGRHGAWKLYVGFRFIFVEDPSTLGLWFLILRLYFSPVVTKKVFSFCLVFFLKGNPLVLSADLSKTFSSSGPNSRLPSK